MILLSPLASTILRLRLANTAPCRYSRVSLRTRVTLSSSSRADPDQPAPIRTRARRRLPSPSQPTRECLKAYDNPWCRCEQIFHFFVFCSKMQMRNTHIHTHTHTHTHIYTYTHHTHTHTHTHTRTHFHAHSLTHSLTHPQRLRSRTQALSSTEVEITWTPPTLPNGVITSYSVFRNISEVYVGTALSYIDAAVSPSTAYSYVVVARTSAGAGTSPATVIVTPAAGSPYAISLPNVLLPRYIYFSSLSMMLDIITVHAQSFYNIHFYDNNIIIPSHNYSESESSPHKIYRHHTDTTSARP